MENKGWHSRGYLPHFDGPGLIQGITYRLWDSLPADVLEGLGSKRETMANPEKRAKVEALLNAGYGECFLGRPFIAKLVEDAWFHFDGERYKLIAWVIMPNHVHVMIETFEGYPLDKVIHSWKSFVANEANGLLRRKGKFWYHDYFDRYVRDEQHYFRAVKYIHENPVVAGLVKQAEDWRFSSARLWGG